MVFVKTIGRKIDSFGNRIAESTSYFSILYPIWLQPLIWKNKFLKNNSLLRKNFCSRMPIFKYSRFCEIEEKISSKESKKMFFFLWDERSF